MKKSLLFFTLLAGIAVMTGCKKDQDVITLKAIIDTDSKAYFADDDITPYWDNNDLVCVMGAGYENPSSCELSEVTNSYATIENVLISSNGKYCAIYPFDIVEEIDPPADNGQTHAVIYYRPDQQYIWDATNNRQRINMPMGAVTDGNTFYFKNLCSILRLDVKNDYGQTVKVGRITVQSHGAYVAGFADVTLTKNRVTQFHLDGLEDYEDNVLSVYPPSYGTSFVEGVGVIKEMDDGDEATFDVVVPPFDADELNIELELYDNNNNLLGNSDITIIDPPALALNKIVTFKMTTSDGFETADYAYIERGLLFKGHLREILNSLREEEEDAKITSIKFNKVESNDRPNSSAKNVKDNHSTFNIWAYPVSTDGLNYTIQIDCAVDLIYANKDCSHMFEDLADLETIVWTNTSTSGFQTEDVIDMSYMFAGCTKLRSISGSNFNTTNVRTMAHMFESCHSFSNGWNLGISDFSTHNLRNMEAMFKDCYLLQSLPISGYKTGRVSDMSELFSGCLLLKELDISRLQMDNVTDKRDMFKDLGTDRMYASIIYCTDATWSAIQTGTSLPSNTEHQQPTVAE